MRTVLGNKRGQSMVEYIIIVVVVALAALAIFGVFGDRLRAIVSGASVELGADQSKADEATQTGSAAKIKEYENKGG
jgi:type IV pilus assembly protein PilA